MTGAPAVRVTVSTGNLRAIVFVRWSCKPRLSNSNLHYFADLFVGNVTHQENSINAVSQSEEEQAYASEIESKLTVVRSITSVAIGFPSGTRVEVNVEVGHA